MNRLISLGTLCVIVLFSSAGFAADRFVGSWKLNYEKSQSAASGVNVLNIEPRAEGLRFETDITLADGTVYRAESIRIFDSREYPVAGKLKDMTFESTRTDPNTINIVNRKGGREVATQLVTVSEDGKTLTRVIRIKNSSGADVFSSVLVYDRQLAE